MKRYLAAIAVFLISAAAVSAKSGFGVTAGMNFNSAKIKDVKMDARAGWSAGVTYLIDLPIGFSLQPSLLYSHKEGSLDFSAVESIGDLFGADVVQKLGSVNLPVSVQWGPDLIFLRPFLDVTPYVGYSLKNEIEGKVAGLKGAFKGENAFEYGLGLGAGLNVKDKVQAIVRYNWNFGAMGSLKDFKDIDYKGLSTENQTFGGITFNLAFFF